jgi:hypothetical protein
MTQRKPPVFEIIDSSPELLNKAADFLNAGGERLLHALNDTIKVELWPWDKPAETTAQYGAFCAGVAWATKFMRNLVALSANRQAALELLAQTGASHVDEEARKILMQEYGFSEEQTQEK